MANVYANTDVQAGKIGAAANVSGVKQFEAIIAWSVAAADAAGTVYRVFSNIPSDAIITSLDIMNEAVTGATGALIGLYNSLKFDGVGGILGSGNQFHTNFDLSSANAISSGFVNAMPAVSIANRAVQLYSLVGQVQYPASTTGPKASAYDVCLTMANKTTVATGAVVMRMRYVRGV
jgi:hypothetical protein